MAAHFKLHLMALLPLLALAAMAEEVPATSTQGPLADGNVDDSQGRRLVSRHNDYWSHGDHHHHHPSCRSHFSKADISRTRRLRQPCGLNTTETCACADPPYREFDGTCNNPNTTTLGAAQTLYNRVLRARYADGVHEMVHRTPSGRLPEARTISESIFKDKDRKDRILSMMVMQWGDSIAHDGGLRRNLRNDNGSTIDCCSNSPPSSSTDRRAAARRARRSAQESSSSSEESSSGEEEGGDPRCVAFRIGKHDHHYTRDVVTCVNFVRSQYVVCSNESDHHTTPAPGGSGESSEEREGRNPWRRGRRPPSRRSANQWNEVTSFLDLSIVYGNNRDDNDMLREGTGGRLRSREVRDKDEWHSSEESSSSSSEELETREFLPLSSENIFGCNPQDHICYLAGDILVNSQPWVASMQILLLREHNRLADRLRSIHPDWDDEILFQEARRILIAQWQLITYRDYLPKIVGKKILKRMGLIISPYMRGNYSRHVNPSTLNEFSQGAFRFLHSMVDGTVELLNEGRCAVKKLRLSEHFNNPSVVEYGSNFEDIIRGLTQQAAQRADRFVTKEMKYFGLEQVSDDIQRGRDHGVPSYNAMRDMCGLRKAVDFEDFRDVMTEKSIKMLKHLYRSTNDVDLYVGGTLEQSCVDGDDGAIVGPTFGCIIAEQFYRWRKGDRYFFDHANGPGRFTEEQYRALHEVTLASIICENLPGEKYMQLDPFEQISHHNELRRCRNIPRLDMKPWKNYTPRQCPTDTGNPTAT